MIPSVYITNEQIMNGDIQQLRLALMSVSGGTGVVVSQARPAIIFVPPPPPTLEEKLEDGAIDVMTGEHPLTPDTITP
jgi:hypothetical protein